MRWFRRTPLPPAFRHELHADEAVTAHAETVDGTQLAVTRRRLLMLPTDGQRSELAWSQVAKAALARSTLTLVPLQAIGDLPDGGMLAVDGDPLVFTFPGTTRLTDQVHARVRASVVASRHLPWPGAGGWVTTRRVAGQDGLTLQVRLDAGADPGARGFLPAALQLGDDLRSRDPSGVGDGD